jgi:hypothetical protein
MIITITNGTLSFQLNIKDDLFYDAFNVAIDSKFGGLYTFPIGLNNYIMPNIQNVRYIMSECFESHNSGIYGDISNDIKTMLSIYQFYDCYLNPENERVIYGIDYLRTHIINYIIQREYAYKLYIDGPLIIDNDTKFPPNELMLNSDINKYETLLYDIGAMHLIQELDLDFILPDINDRIHNFIEAAHYYDRSKGILNTKFPHIVKKITKYVDDVYNNIRATKTYDKPEYDDEAAFLIEKIMSTFVE